MNNIKALLVGVCEYPTAGYPSLPFCVNDVQSVRGALITGLNVPETNVKICGNGAIVTIRELIAELRPIVSESAEKDTFIFYFSGHGGKNILALSDGNLNLQSLIDVIDNIHAKNKIIILDCCHSGEFAISDMPDIDLFENVGEFVGHGCTVLASCDAAQTSGFNQKRRLSVYTSFLVDALTLHSLVRKGKKSLESINEAVSHFAKIWNSNHPLRTQNPIYRSNVCGTIFFDVEDYNPYRIENIYEENETYIIYSVEPVHTGQAKRFSAKVILRYASSLEEIADIANEVNSKIKYADVYQNELSEARHRGKPANIIWCYFGYSEDNIIDSNYICHTTWVDDTQDEKWWYRQKKNSIIIDGVYLEIHPSYEMLNQFLHKQTVSKEGLIDETNYITRKLVKAAEDLIKIYREYCNGALRESELIQAAEPINHEIAHLFLLQSNLPYPPKELHEWANLHTQLAGTIQDIAIYYDKRNINKWAKKIGFLLWILPLNVTKTL